MGVCHQLRLLLWKNFMLKKSRPLVLLFELFIPLVLFLILVSIRRTQPPNHYGPTTYTSWPLPSAGLVSVLQLFCDGGDYVDQYGFKIYKDATHNPNIQTGKFLSYFKSVAENNNFFDPGFTPKEMDDIPRVYKSIIDNPANLRDHFQHAHDFSLLSVMTNQTNVQDFLSQNLSLSTSDIHALMNAKVNVTELYKLIFGLDLSHNALPRAQRSILLDAAARAQLDAIVTRRKRSSIRHVQEASYYSSLLKDIIAKHIPEYQSGMVYRVLDPPEDEVMSNVELIQGIVQLLGFTHTNDVMTRIDPDRLVNVMKLVLLRPHALREIVCNETITLKLLIPQPPYSESDIIDSQQHLCKLSHDQMLELSRELQQQISDEKLIEIFHLQHWNTTQMQHQIDAFKTDLKDFLLFQRNLFELTELAETLPKDACPREVHITTTSVPFNDTDYADGNMTDIDDGDKIDDDEKDDDDDDTKPLHRRKHNKYAGLLRVWYAMQKTVCGVNPHIPTKKIEKIEQEDSMKGINLEELGFTKRQQKNIGILLHVLYSNPKVLYSPNGTAADGVISKANSSFVIIDKVNEYANKWLNISADLREYLSQDKTAQNLRFIKQIQADIKSRPYLRALLESSDTLSQFLSLDIPDADYYLHQLDVIDNAACSWSNLMSGVNLNVFQGFPTEVALLNYIQNQAYADNVSVIASVVFENMLADGKLPPHLRYKIRQNASFTFSTRFIRPRSWWPGPGKNEYPYYHFGFVWIQDIIERAVINLQVGHDVVEPGLFVHQFPYPCFTSDQFLFLIEHIMPLCLNTSFLYTVAMLVQSIVYEKEQRLKEVMKMMGLDNAIHWCSWFITSFLQMTVTMGALVAMLHYSNVLPYSNPWIIFLVLEVFAIAIIWFSFLISVLYSKAKIAAACAGIIYLLTYVPCMYIAIREGIAGVAISAVTKSFACLFSTTAFGLGAKYFAFYEENGVGVQWNNLHVSPVEEDNYSLLHVIVMLLVDTVIYAVLVWYIENVHPGSYGLPRAWYFPFTKSYWCGYSATSDNIQCPSLSDCLRRGRTSEYLSLMEEDQACAMLQGNPQHFEPAPAHLPRGVSIDGLTKIYKQGKKLAVNKLSLNLYEGQITSFLGHNGAGKTTTMSILTGLFPPTSGSATIYGHDIRTSMDVIRRSLGMCPQHSVLFDKLTVEEHLWFYAHLKGMDKKQIKPEMDRMIADLGLLEKRKSKVHSLSGGMQRKLSVAIAFVGGSHTVILDEPTAGVDPYSRRAIWDLLIKYKKDRTILLSTHYMNEAEILGDRIAIISNGQLKCCGSALFLKNTFGEGYHLTLVKGGSSHHDSAGDVDMNNSDTQSITSFTENEADIPTSDCSAAKVTKFIKKYVSTAYLRSENQHELQYILPFEEAKKGNFEKLFLAFETGLDDLGVSSFGVKDATLEEVFLKVTEQAKTDEDEASKLEETHNTSNATTSMTANADTSIETQQTDQSTDSIQHGSVNQNEDLEESFSSDDALCDADVQMDRLLTDASGYMRLHRSESEESIGHAVHGHRSRKDGYHRLDNQHDPGNLLDGRGSYVLSGYKLRLNQFRAILFKRFFFIKKNWKSLFSQILLPALFVFIAMTVALSAPGIGDLPPLELSPSQYFNYTQPTGDFIPYSDESVKRHTKLHVFDADPQELIRTLHLPSGVGATCVLLSPFNSSFDLVWRNHNYTLNNFQLLSMYFEPSCARVFEHGLPLQNFVPAIQTISREQNHGNDSIIDPVPLNPTGKKYYPLCKCADDSSGFVCQDDGSISPPSVKVVTTDILQDITGSDINKFFLYTTDQYRLHRYGALTFGLEQAYVPTEFSKSAPINFRKLAIRNVAQVWYNQKGFHAMPTFINTMNNAILRANLPTSKGNKAAYGITVINHPMEGTNNKLSMDFILQGSDVLIAIFIIVAMSFVPASFVLFLVYERSINAKHLQFVSGMDPFIYWVGNYFWDMCNYLIPSGCCIGILLVCDIPAYSSSSNLPAVISLFMLYGWSMTPLMYPASFVFNEPSTAYIFLIVINLFTGITCVVCSFLLEIFSYDPDILKVHNVLKLVFMIFPNYCLGRGLMDIAFNQYKNLFFFKTGQNGLMKSPFVWELTPCKLVAMASMGAIFFVITLILEHSSFIRYRKKKWVPTGVQDEDVDVAAERRRVLRGSGRHDLLRLENLTKVYKGNKLAVDRLCLGVPAGECFGLLGVNGAGKTTTFKMLTGDCRPTGGDAHVNRYSIHKDLLKVQHNIGYCPQFDSLYDELTAREHLQLYARLKGIPPKDEKKVVEWALSKLALSNYADRPSGTYSGGNKRKLSTAIALISHPPIIFLDEPTTGMDPQSRRFLWDIILGLIKDGRSIILTSHSMEECEALCSRLTIMVNGRFRCLGSTQHLKNKYGDGYTISLRLAGPDYDRSHLHASRFLRRYFNSAVLKTEHNVIQFELKSPDVSLAYIFSKLEVAQRDIPIEDYSVSQNTLDNVFINFVKTQADDVRDTPVITDPHLAPLDVGQNPLQRRNYPVSDPELDTDDDLDVTFYASNDAHLSFINMDDIQS